MRTPYSTKFRNRKYLRVRWAQRLKEWLDAQANRLEITSSEVFLLLLTGMTPSQIENKEPEEPEEPEEPKES